MTISLTPAMCEQSYELLRTMPPFRSWRLPHADDVKFIVSRTKKVFAYHNCEANEHCIEVSQRKHGQMGTLLATMAHEMIHIHQHNKKHRDAHGASFNRYADQICRIHGFDRTNF